VKELPAPEELLRPRDHLTVWVPAETWHCPWCAGARSVTTVDWLGRNAEGPHGRCRDCGVKLRLAPWGESVPSVAEQLRGREPLEAQQPGAPE
jgi:hypothetical protein